jgi:putative tryptophan/tyrosine transport system substrate-binding protein
VEPDAPAQAGARAPGPGFSCGTGWSPEVNKVALELLTATVPALSRVGVLAESPDAPEYQAAEVAARALGMELRLLAVPAPDDLERALQAAADERIQAALVAGATVTVTYLSKIAALAASSHLATMSERRDFVQAGGLMAYGPSQRALWRRTAEYVDKVLKGAKPADLPVEQPTTFDFVINLRTAQALGLTIPQHVLLQATEIIQ